MGSQIFETLSTANYGRQIVAAFTVIAKSIEASGPVASKPIPENPTEVALMSQPPVSPDFPADTTLS